jgi:hypothetical protein
MAMKKTRYDKDKTTEACNNTWAELTLPVLKKSDKEVAMPVKVANTKEAPMAIFCGVNLFTP